MQEKDTNPPKPSVVSWCFPKDSEYQQIFRKAAKRVIETKHDNRICGVGQQLHCDMRDWNCDKMILKAAKWWDDEMFSVKTKDEQSIVDACVERFETRQRI